MGERVTFVTDYIYCDKCLKAIKKAMNSRCNNPGSVCRTLSGHVIAGFVKARCWSEFLFCGVSQDNPEIISLCNDNHEHKIVFVNEYDNTPSTFIIRRYGFDLEEPY